MKAARISAAVLRSISWYDEIGGPMESKETTVDINRAYRTPCSSVRTPHDIGWSNRPRSGRTVYIETVLRMSKPIQGSANVVTWRPHTSSLPRQHTYGETMRKQDRLE